MPLPQPRDVVRLLERRGLEHQLVEPSQAPPLRGLGDVEPPDLDGRVAVAVPDHTRPVPLVEVLRVLEPLLPRALLIFATGTHPMGRGDAERLLGPYGGAVRYKIHDCRGSHTYVGTTGRGLRVEVDSDFAAADRRVTVGLVAPHPWSGFSGGSKVVLPGVSSLRTVVEHHLRWYSAGRPAVLEGNPFREEIDEAGRLAKVDWSLNLVLDGGGKLVYAAAGDPQRSFRECVEVAERLYVRRVEGRFDSAVVFADPLDIDFYQATKALEHAAPAVEEGGSIVLVASCSRGFGSEEFERYVRMSAEEVRRRIEGGAVENLVPAIVALRFKEIAETRSLTLLCESGLEVPGAAPSKSAHEALERLRGRVLVVARGGFTVPVVR